MEHSIQVVKAYKNLPAIFKTKAGKIIQLSFKDSSGKLRKFREVKLKTHHGYNYYRINGEQMSDFKLETLAFDHVGTVNPYSDILSYKRMGVKKKK